MACIFLIHHDPNLEASVCPVLENLGHDVFCFASGFEAEVACKALVPDLVITDIDAPEKEGSGFWRRLKSGEHQSSILAISPAETPDDDWQRSVGKASYLGASVLLQPFDRTILEARVQRLLGEA